MKTENKIENTLRQAMFNKRAIYDENDTFICEMIRGNGIRTGKEAEAIASKIVSRYNSQEVLVNALKNIEKLTNNSTIRIIAQGAINWTEPKETI